MSRATANEDRWRRQWDRMASGYDRQMSWSERRFFRDTRPWLCGRADGRTLEVAIGTGLNLAHYPTNVTLTGLEWSVAMLAQARLRAADLAREVDLRQGDARDLPFPDGSFDTVVCTFAICGIPDHGRAVAEMGRVLRPGGLLLMADHVGSTSTIVRGLQHAVEAVTSRTSGEHWVRRPFPLVEAMGFEVEGHDRFTIGIIERFAARKPA